MKFLTRLKGKQPTMPTVIEDRRSSVRDTDKTVETVEEWAERLNSVSLGLQKIVETIRAEEQLRGSNGTY